MRLAIRFADKIVGASIVLALGIAVFVLFMLLAVNQRLFARDYEFFAYLDSAAGLSPNMPVEHVGFTVGLVRSFEPTDDDRVRVRFVVFDTYRDRVRDGSRVELVVSPIPVFGSRFNLHPGPPGGGLLAEGQTVQGARGYDAVGTIIGRVDELLANVNRALVGTDETELGAVLRGVRAAVDGLAAAVESVSADVGRIMADALEPALANIRALTDGIADPDGAVMAILDGEGEVYAGLASSLYAVSGVLQNLERTTALIPEQFPQIVALIVELQSVMRAAEDVLLALSNNPLLRRGVPERAPTGPGGAFARDMEF